MFEDEKKKKTNYGSIIVYCFFCFVFIMGIIRFSKHAYHGLKQNQMVLNVTPRSVFVPAHENDEKLTAATTAFRDLPPTSYCVNLESFMTLSKDIKNGMYESRPFSVGGYNWTFQIYPNGNKDDNGAGYVSIYVKLQNTSLLIKEVNAEIKFFIYSKAQDKYFTYQETESKRFHLFKPDWGFGRFYAITAFQAPALGFIFDGGKCVFCVDIFVAPPFKKWEVMSYEDNIRDPVFDWKLTNFSTRGLYYYYTSGPFSSGGRNWELKVYPTGVRTATANSLSLFLLSSSNENGYVKAKLRVRDQIRNTYVEKLVEGWPNATENGWGIDKFIQFTDLKNASTGFIVNDTLIVGVQMVSFYKTESYSI